MSTIGSLQKFYEKPRELIELPWWVRLLDLLGVKNVSRINMVGSLIPECRRLLDIGCGDGKLIINFASKKTEECWGIDISPILINKAITSAKNNNRENVHFMLRDFQQFTTRQKFDVVTATAYLEHVIFPLRMLKKINRLMVQNGSLIIEVPNTAYLLHRISLLLGNFPETAPTVENIPGVDEEHLRFFTLATLTKALELTGFKLEKVTTSGRLSFLRRFFPSLLGADLIVKACKT